MSSSPRLAVLASGNGSNLQALIDAHQRKDLSAPIVLVISNNSKAGALERARRNQIPAFHISGHTHLDPDSQILERLLEYRAEIIVLAGYLKRVSSALLAAFPRSIVNIHPAPLPRFGGPGMFGRRVHQAVIDSGVKNSGATVHLVNKEYDQGDILAHQPVPVEIGDTTEELAGRVLAAEHQLLWQTLQDQFCAETRSP